MLYFLLTGQPPFVGETQDEVWDRARRCDFETGALRLAKVPRRLETVCLKALAADPVNRYATAEEMAAALRRFAHRSSGRMRWTILGLFLLGVALAVSLWQGRRDSTLRREQSGVLGLTAIDARRTPSSTLDQVNQMVKVDRRGTPLDLRDALPMQAGDSIWIEGDLPAGRDSSAFFFDSEGLLTPLEPIAVTRGSTQDHFVFPPRGAVPLEGPPGTELILIFAVTSRSLPREDLESLLPIGRPLPPIPDQSRVVLDRSGSELRILRKLGAPQSSAAREAETWFQALRETLVLQRKVF